MKQNEQLRLLSVRRFDEYEFDLDNGLQGILALAAEVCQTPVAFITIMDEDTQFFKVCRGMNVNSMPRASSFCTYTIDSDDVMVVPDPSIDERFKEIPLVAHEPHIRFYAGAPLKADDGQNIGTLCVFDAIPKQLDQNKLNMLSVLAKQATHLMELELCLKLIKRKSYHIELQNKALTDIAFTQSHEFRGPPSTVMGFMRLIKDDDYMAEKEHLLMMEEALLKLDEKILLVVQSTQVARSIYNETNVA